MESASTGSTGTRQELDRNSTGSTGKASTAPRQRPRQRLAMSIERLDRARLDGAFRVPSAHASSTARLCRLRPRARQGSPPRRAPAPPRRPTWENSKRPVTHDLNIQSAFAGLVACGNCYYVRTIEHTTYGRRQQLSVRGTPARARVPDPKHPSSTFHSIFLLRTHHLSYNFRSCVVAALLRIGQ